jgi:hypothetical protein
MNYNFIRLLLLLNILILSYSFNPIYSPRGSKLLKCTDLFENKILEIYDANYHQLSYGDSGNVGLSGGIEIG